jgi:hypothetical protein
MQGPHSLTSSNVDKKVDDRIGVYRLYNSRRGPVRYVGMSTDLASRLKQWTGEYEYFEYGYHSSKAAAYRSEATLYHRHGGKEELDNDKHPPRPHRQVKCPVCGIHSAV